MGGASRSWTAGPMLAVPAVVMMSAGCDLASLPESTPETGETQDVAGTRVIDGDTFTATDRAGTDLGRMRILGIDTPEMPQGDQPGECHAEEATQAAKELLENATVRISQDPTQPERDRYARLLVYVYVDADGTDFGLTMLTEGHAHLYQDATVTRQDDYTVAAAHAEDRQAGLWGQCP